MTQPGEIDTKYYPRVQAMKQPEDVHLEAYSRFNVKRRNEVGYYRGRDFEHPSGISAAKTEALSHLKDSRGRYRCPFCRYEEASVFTTSFEKER